MGLYSRCSSGCVKLSTLGQVGSAECCGPLLTQVAVGECSNNSEPNSRISSTEGGDLPFAAPWSNGASTQKWAIFDLALDAGDPKLMQGTFCQFGFDCSVGKEIMFGL